MPITELLSCNAKKYPNEVSLIEREPAKGVRREITWLEFEKEANRFSNALIECGIKQGDRVALLMMNCLEWLPVCRPGGIYPLKTFQSKYLKRVWQLKRHLQLLVHQ
jgi:non-ribosomal peptide synthetase component E (peptide arylation enzyme)